MTKKGLLLHHWDADGICSAVILMKELKKREKGVEWALFTPRIGNYFLTEAELDVFKEKGFDEVVIADMAIPKAQVEVIRASSKRVRHFDHHIQDLHGLEGVEHVNPISEGKDPDAYPSCTYVLKEYFKYDMDLPTVLGVIGDLEYRLYDNKDVLEDIEGFMKVRGLSFFDLMRMANLIDSNYKTDDADGVKEAVRLLSSSGENPAPILFHDRWRRKAREVSLDVNKLLRTQAEVVDGKAVIRIASRNHTISTIGRMAFRQRKVPVVIINTGIADLDQVYARGADMTEAIEYARSLGLRAGGKHDVIGVLLEKGKVEAFLPELLKRIPSETI